MKISEQKKKDQWNITESRTLLKNEQFRHLSK